MSPLFDLVIWDLIKRNMDMCTDTVTAAVVASPVDVELRLSSHPSSPRESEMAEHSPRRAAHPLVSCVLVLLLVLLGLRETAERGRTRRSNCSGLSLHQLVLFLVSCSAMARISTSFS